MNLLISAPRRALTAILALTLAFTTACASGGFKLTRRYSAFVNRQHVVLRVILYVLTLPVFWVTLLIDEVINNTIDFWDGRVSQGTFQFNRGDRTFVAQHEIKKDGLKASHIEIFGRDQRKIQDVRLVQTSASSIEVFIDGVLEHRVSDVHSLPQLTSFNQIKDSLSASASAEGLIANR